MKLSLIAAGLAIAVSTFALVEARNMVPATATANAATETATVAPAPAPAPLPALLPVPNQIGGQKIAPAAQEGVSCLIDKKNDKDACGDVAMKREIAKCVGGIGVQSTIGKKHAIATTNDLSDESLKAVVAKSEALAKLSPDDPETLPGLGPQQYMPVNGYFDSTANLTPEARARAALTALEPARKSGNLKAAGFIIVNAGSNALGNSRGLFAYNRSTNANYTLTVRTNDGTGSGWVGAEHPDWSQLDFAGLANRAIETAKLSQNPVAIEPGRYTVILEPQAVGDLVQLMGGSLAARAADEGRSAFTKQGGGNKIGEKIVDSRVTIFSDPQDPQLLGLKDDIGLLQCMISERLADMQAAEANFDLDHIISMIEVIQSCWRSWDSTRTEYEIERLAEALKRHQGTGPTRQEVRELLREKAHLVVHSLFAQEIVPNAGTQPLGSVE